MKIEVLIDELQEIIDEAFTLPLSGGITLVNTERIREIIEKRQLDACADWKAFGEELSGQTVDDFVTGRYFE